MFYETDAVTLAFYFIPVGKRIEKKWYALLLSDSFFIFPKANHLFI